MYYIIEVAHKNVQVIAQLLFAKDVMASGHRASLLETEYSTEVSTMIFFKQLRQERFPLFLSFVFATSFLLLLFDIPQKLERACP